ncbi:MAG: hypothetical protein ACUVRS_02930 [Armatimonadota bacterium]
MKSLNKQATISTIATGLLCLLLATCSLEGQKWTVVDARWRPDVNPFKEKQVWEDYVWTEGWNYEEQFYPRYMRPAGSIHIVLRNDSRGADSLTLASFNGKPLNDVVTTENKLGPVIWYMIESPQLPVDPNRPDDSDLNIQKAIPPGEWVMCTLRLREPLTKPCDIGFKTGVGEEVRVRVEPTPRLARIDSVSFSPEIDRIYVYVRSLNGRIPKNIRLWLDGKSVPFQKTAGSTSSALILICARVNPEWQYGSFHLVQVDFGREKLVEPVRAWDGYFCIGLFGTITEERVAAAKRQGFNTYFWHTSEILGKAEMCTIPHGASKEWKSRTTGSKRGVLFLYNKDEPDAQDASMGDNLPFVERLGLNAIPEVIPAQRTQRRLMPTVPNLLLVNNTYKPLNYYVYGQIPDIFSTDPYVPLNGRQVDYVYHALECARDASTPRPLLAVLWACSLSGKRKFGSNAPTPEEIRMMIYYAIGCGVKGIGYFIDMTQETGEGQFVGLSDIKPLWEAVGQANMEISSIARFLSIGCPASSYCTRDKVWIRTLMCGPDSMIVVVVNKNHYIAFETQKETSFHFPLKKVSITVELPPTFKHFEVKAISNGKLLPFPYTYTKHGLSLFLDTLDAAEAFLVQRVR